MEEIRLNKFLSEMGVCSRREADRFVESGRVQVNGKPAELGQKIRETDEITLDGKPVAAEQKDKPVLIAFNKPRGIVCTTSAKDRATNIIEYINYPVRIFPIGRLDKDSEGIILLTNQGDLVNKINRQRYGHEKEYVVRCKKKLTKTFLNDSAVNSRLRGVGLLTKQQAHDLGAVGPFMRASGIALDNRKLGYAAYSDLNFEPVTSEVGDCYARCDVRIREIFQSIDLIRQAASKIPGGEVAVPFKGFPEGEYFMREEQPRGEAIYYVKANGTKFIDRFRVRTPTFANLPALIQTLKGCQLADVPIMILTIDPCISCTER